MKKVMDTMKYRKDDVLVSILVFEVAVLLVEDSYSATG